MFVNACGNMPSNVIAITVNPLPTAPTANTTPNTVCVGAPNGTITINTLAGITGFSLDGTTFQSSPTFSGLPGGTHTIFVQNASGCISNGATVTIANQHENPELGTMVVTPSETICNPHTGGNIVIAPTFTSAGASPTFVWSVGETNIATTQNLTLTTPPTTTTTYRVAVTNAQSNCVTYFEQTISVTTQPVITTQPVGGAICVGQPVIVLSAAATSDLPNTYQWQSSTDNVTFTDILAARATSLTVPNSTEYKF